MSNDGKITLEVEGKPLSFEKKDLTANEIIKAAQEAGIPAAQDGVEKLTLKGNESGKIYRGEDRIDFSDDTTFSIGRLYLFTVNGQQLTSLLQKLVALDIIKMAQEKGAIPTVESLEEWKLEAGGSHFQGSEWVDLGQFMTFVAILNKATPVA